MSKKRKLKLSEAIEWCSSKSIDATCNNIIRPVQFYCIELIEHWFFDPKDYADLNKTGAGDSVHYPETVFKCFTQIKEIETLVEGLMIELVNRYYLPSDNFYEIKVYEPCLNHRREEMTTHDIKYRLYIKPSALVANQKAFVEEMKQNIRETFRETEEYTKDEFHKVLVDYREKV